MKVLIIHHLEMVWEQCYKSCNTSFDEIAEGLISHLDKNNYDRVILTRFEDCGLGDEHYQLLDYIDQVEEYSYGWELESLNKVRDLQDRGIYVSRNDKYDDWAGWTLLGLNKTWAFGGTHSEVVLIEDWMHELKEDQVSICGAFDGECIEDLELALSAIDINYKRIESLIV